MKNWFKKTIDIIGSPELDWIQVEITNHCNASCIYCPHGSLKNLHHMALEQFIDLLSYLKYTDLIYLQGWGEPLLHEDIFEMIHLCKKKGKRVGFTTNGMLLNDDTIHRLIDLKLDIICVSLAGAAPSTHNSIRRGTDLNKIFENLENFAAVKKMKNAAFPALHFAYLMLLSNFHELKDIIPFAKKFGAAQIIAGNPTIIVNDDIRNELLYNSDNHDSYSEMLDEIKESAAKENILFSFSTPKVNKFKQQCSENICSSCFINVEGKVSPCVFTSPTVSASPMTFGDISTERLTKIWNKKEYFNYRKLFCLKKHLTGENEFYGCCDLCLHRTAARDA